MRIGFIFQRDPRSGGSFTYELSMALTFKRLSEYDIYFFVYDENQRRILAKYGIDAIILRKSPCDSLIRKINRSSFVNWLPKKITSGIEKQLKRYGVDLVYFPSPEVLSIDLLELNFVITVLDLCHLDFPEFPEVNFHREFEMREEIYNRALRKAVAVITDNEHTKRKICEVYGVNPERVKIIPYSYVAYSYLTRIEIKDACADIRSKYSIKGDYIYYPAQFWPHKNHVYVIDAIKILHKRDLQIEAVFSGSDKGNLRYVLDYARKSGVSDHIKYVGFVSDEDKYFLYKNALALVMPTYFGPTNLPPFEAFAIGVPVIHSDLDVFREQLKDAVMFCDLQRPESLADCVESLFYDRDLRDRLVEKGKKIIQSSVDDEQILKTLRRIFSTFQSRLKCWKS